MAGWLEKRRKGLKQSNSEIKRRGSPRDAGSLAGSPCREVEGGILAEIEILFGVHAEYQPESISHKI
jgi:hypothetical protein